MAVLVRMVMILMGTVIEMAMVRLVMMMMVLAMEMMMVVGRLKTIVKHQ